MTSRAPRERKAAARREGAPAPGGEVFAWPRLSELVDWRGPWLLPLVLLLAFRLDTWRRIPFAAEDAYITFRYARSLASGFGLVFNPGERVFGFSSPLWTVWMTLGFLVNADPVIWSRATTLALEILALVAMIALLRRSASVAAAFSFGFFFAVWPYFSAVAVSGMENPVLMALIVLSAVWAERGSLGAGPALAALGLVRPEGLVCALVVGLRARWRDRWVGLALLGIAIAALTVYYGSPLPQSVIAKSRLYGTPGPIAGRHWWDWVSPFVFGRFPPLIETQHLFLMCVVFTPAMVLGARALWPRRGGALAVAIAASLLVWLGYAALGVAYFWWYLVVPLMGLSALAAVGLPLVTRGRSVPIALGLLALGLWTVTPQLYLGRAQAEYMGFAQVGTYLRTNARPGEKALLEPIGMVGFQAPLVIVDEVGLISPKVAERRLRGAGWYTDVVASERPDWLVIRRGVLEQGRSFAGQGAPFRAPAERDSLLQRYAIVAQVDTVSGPNTLLVLRRR